MNAITQVPGGARSAERTRAGGDASGGGDFEIALGAASAPPTSQPAGAPAVREHDGAGARATRTREVAEGGPGDARGTNEPPGARSGVRPDDGPTPGDAAVKAESGAQNAPAPPHAVGDAPLVGPGATAAQLPPAVTPAGATPDASAAPQGASAPPDGPARANAPAPAAALPATPGFAVRVVAARSGAARDGATRASGDAAGAPVPAPSGLRMPPASAPMPVTPAAAAAATGVPQPPAGGVPAKDAAPAGAAPPRNAQAGPPADPGVRTVEAASRDATGSDRKGRDDSARGRHDAPGQGIEAAEPPSTSAPQAVPAFATGAARASATTADAAPKPGADAAVATAPAADARFEPMRRAADQVTLQFQGEGGLEGRLRIAVRGDTVSASILSSHEGTLQRLGGEAGTLRRALDQQGFSNAKVSVHDLRTGGATHTSDTRQNAREGDDRRQGEPQRRSGQGREYRQGGDSAKDRRASRDERRSA